MLNFPALYAEAWTAPRRSMRRILDMSLAERDRIIMVAITGVLFAIPVSMIIRSIVVPPLEDGTVFVMPSTLKIAMIVVTIVIIAYYVTAGLIKLIGGAFGGTASFTECKTVAAWSQFVMGLGNLAVSVVALALPTMLGNPLSFAFTIAAFIVASAYIAEGHGFTHTGKVVAVYVGAILVLILFLSALIPVGMIPQPS